MLARMGIMCKLFGHKYTKVEALRYNYYRTKCSRCGFEGVGHTSTLGSTHGVVELTDSWRKMIKRWDKDDPKGGYL